MHHASGSLAYETYSRSVRYRNCQGDPLPAWDDLPHAVKVAWECVAITVAGESFRLADEAALRNNDLI